MLKQSLTVVDGGRQPATSPSTKAQQVVVLDDQSVQRIFLEGVLKGIGSHVQVHLFQCGIDTLDFICKHPVDLVVTDYRMPVMNGLEFVVEARKIPGMEDVPIVMVTIVEEKPVMHAALREGVTDFLTKPLDPYETQARCRNLLSLRHYEVLAKQRATQLEQQVLLAARRIDDREKEAVLLAASLAEYRQQQSDNHILRVGRFSRLMAQALGLSERDCNILESAAAVHDVGKLSLPDAVIFKEGPLTAEETRLMRTHVEIGHALLVPVESEYAQVGAIVALRHHERWDGSGYPHGLERDEIPLAARVVALADTFDALVSPRPQGAPVSAEAAMAYIWQQRGKEHDPKCVDAFMHRQDDILAALSALRSTGEA